MTRTAAMQDTPEFPNHCVPAFDRSAAVITVSDRGASGAREDLSGRVLTEVLEVHGYAVKVRAIVPDEMRAIVQELERCTDQERVALIVTTGGTGVSPRDVTPEATLQVVERIVPGMAEAMRAASLSKTANAMISRAVVGIRKATLIVNLPGSPKAALENLEVLLPALSHALEKIQGDPSECGHREKA
jgi:molybdenum cofactor synthesis domain-containing protein